MDHDKSNMKSETEGKETSGANSDHSSRLCSSEEDFAETNPAENNAAQILGITQPYFVADTLEDDDESLIIPPTQEDSAPLMIPNTPVLEERSKSTREVDLDASTVSVLEETCVDLENKSDPIDSSKEGLRDPSTSYSCIENDFTQDLDLEPTQPIILSHPTEEDGFNKVSTDTNKKDEDDDQDDDWQLKFSETQTQDLLNFEKENEEEKENISGMPKSDLLEKKDAKQAVDVDDDEDDDDLPATLSIEVPNRMEDIDCSINESKCDENPDIIDIQSDDEIEPSQSCLSEYKGETISASFKPQGNSDVQNNNASVEDIPKLSSEAGLDFKECAQSDTKDSEIIVEREIKLVNLSESEPREGFTGESKDLLENKSLSIEEISLEDVIEDKEVTHNNSDASMVANDVNFKEEKSLSEKEKTPEETLLTKEETLTKQDENSSESTLKVSGAKEVETVETNGESGEEIQEKDNHKIVVMDVVNDLEDKESHISNSNEEKSTVIKFNKPSSQDLKEKKSEEKLESVSKDSLQYQNKTEVKEIGSKDTKSIISNSEKSDKEIAIDVSASEKVESVKDSISEDSKVNDTELLEKANHPVSEEDKFVKSTESSVPVIDLQPNISDEVEQTNVKQAAEAKPETPHFKLPALADQKYGFAKRKSQNKVIFHETSTIGKPVSSFLEGMEKILDKEKMQVLHSKQNEEIEIKFVFGFANQMYFLKAFSTESEHQRDSGRSPASSSSTVTSSTISSKTSILSGELADIDNSSSSPKSCGIQTDFPINSIIPLSQETDGTMLEFPKTSTQKTSDPVALSEAFNEKESAEKSKTADSTAKLPSKSKRNAKSNAPKRKKGGRKNAETSSTAESSVSEPKRKRARATKAKVAEEVKSEETTEDSKELFVEPKTKKPTRKKKGAAVVPDIKPEEIKSLIEKIEITTDDDAAVQEEANFGSILPGVKVMARWKDGYYYSGMVERQEADGKWAVRFEDNFLRPITLENLIKIAILPKGSSVLVQSPDDYFDPGIICGHFREGNKVGYEVELDNGVTRRYPRSAVILSGDQAKQIMSTRPPTTPATMTINLDNIIDGKRKRKSVQSPVSSPVPAKKSPRITRSKKPDSNLESTADSSEVDVFCDKNKSSESEEPAPKKRKGKATKATKTTTASSKDSKESKPSTAESSNAAKPKVLPQRSAVSKAAAKKLFKDYAFLLTNADRKVIPKPPDASDSDIKEEDDIVPFDKEELCEHIKSGGGIIIEKFEDIKKCSRKQIYLLANSYLRTMKYIQCIAAGISCIKHHWVQNCVFKAEILSVGSYILPSGYSMVSQKVIEWHGKTDVFKGCKIALVSAPESPFVYTWAPVLLAAKAEFVQKWSLPTSVSGCSVVVDVLITNHHCPPDIIQSAKKRKIPIVSSEWIIHCLIEGKRLPFDAHPKFKYDYTEK